MGCQLTWLTKYISAMNCPYYNQICTKWFIKFGLIVLDNPEYVLSLKNFESLIQVTKVSDCHVSMKVVT